MDVPGRPVISNYGTPIEGVLAFVDFHLQPIIRTLAHIIKDTTEFLSKLKELDDIPDGAIICTTDVVGLYPHIPHDEGLKSMKEMIEESEKGLSSTILSQDLIELAKVILGKNFSEFDNKIYWQKLGTTIGTKFAPSFANMFLSKLERNMLCEYHLKPLVWWRFWTTCS